MNIAWWVVAGVLAPASLPAVAVGRFGPERASA